MNLIGVLEGLLFVAGEEGLTYDQLVKLLELEKEEIEKLVLQLSQICEDETRGVRVQVLGERFKFVTKKEHSPYYKKMVECEENTVLSQSALETLAIIAYNEPVTRVQIDEIRGVSSAYVVRKLLLHELIEEEGRSDLPGRPFLYRTTSKFLDYFGLSSKDELPKMEEIEVIDDVELDLFESKYKEIDNK